jgi:hypothetical protein
MRSVIDRLLIFPPLDQHGLGALIQSEAVKLTSVDCLAE